MVTGKNLEAGFPPASTKGGTKMTEQQKRNIRLFKMALEMAVANYAEAAVDEITEDYEMLDPEVVALTDMIIAIKKYTEG